MESWGLEGICMQHSVSLQVPHSVQVLAEGNSDIFIVSHIILSHFGSVGLFGMLILGFRVH